jgi:hypothetical protein
VEYRGYKPYIDPRGEVFLKKNNGKEDILYEWDDFTKGKVKTEELMEKYQFDYILAREDDPFYELEDAKYEKIFDDDDEKVEVYRRVR